jgi:phosphohistidine phosphatase SixA
LNNWNNRTRPSSSSSSSSSQDLKKINYDSDEDLVVAKDFIGQSIGDDDDEPDKFDLMNSTMVPYEKLYRLVLLRHAKSSYTSWAFSESDEGGKVDSTKKEEDDEDEFDLPDKFRSIALRGRRGASAVASNFIEEFPEFIPDIVITSDATRCLDTLETFVAAASEFGCASVVLAPEFYEVSHGSDVKAKRIKKIVTKKIKRETELRPQTVNVMLVGHNMGWENLVRLLANTNNSEKKKVRMKTSNCALLSQSAMKSNGSEKTWEEALNEGEWKLEAVLKVPKAVNRQAKLDFPEDDDDSNNWAEDEEDEEENDGGEFDLIKYEEKKSKKGGGIFRSKFDSSN